MSHQETVVLSLVVRGLTDREVAQQLSIAFSTARKHRENLLRKLEVGKASALVAIFLCLGTALTCRPVRGSRRRRCQHANSTCWAAWRRG
ncbi:LuxR C-terminal-related transcriptional regulator [Pseudomonas sp. MAFF 301350]|uniref:LuxR C-terminal-related transcriptional regulator n=1 Tax=Pseudomonas aegrilactucae TaxID=2854028 RepID=A0A9Q2XH46_9PSED|nr:LuxR C-terminal-related transcriptional regulator [Pseudomonas aegrilactucae]